MPRLRQLNGAEAGRLVGLRDGPIEFRGGRPDDEPAEDVVYLNDESVSGRHALLEMISERHRVVDLGSTNGTWVNDERILRKTLTLGDRLRLGRVSFVLEPGMDVRFRLSDAEIYWPGTERMEVVQAPHTPRARDVLLSVKQTTTRRYTHADLTGAHHTGVGADDDPILTHLLPQLGPDRAMMAASVLLHFLHRMMDHTTLEELWKAIVESLERLLPEGEPSIWKPTETGWAMVAGPESLVLGRKRLLEKSLQTDGCYWVRDTSVLGHGPTAEALAEEARSLLCGALTPPGASLTEATSIYVQSRPPRWFERGDLVAFRALLHSARIAWQGLALRRALETKRDQVRLLSCHIDEKIAGQLLACGRLEETLAPRIREVAILFADICAFTRWASSRTPEEVGTFLNRYFHVMSEIILEGQGTLDKYIGDGILAFFGAPEPLEEKESHAFEVARSMIRASERLRLELSGMFSDLAIRIGLHVGEVCVGRFGSWRRKEYTVLGDVVNVAARVEAAASPNEIWVTREFRSRLSPKAMIREVPHPVAVKNRGELWLFRTPFIGGSL